MGVTGLRASRLFGVQSSRGKYTRQKWADIPDAALLLFARAIVFQGDLSAAANAPLEENERSLGVDGQSFRFLIKRTSTDIFSAYANRDLHENALAATARG
jgi:hypothetical protein